MRAPRNASTILGPRLSPPTRLMRRRAAALALSSSILLVTVAMSRSAAGAAGPPPQPNAAQIALGLRKLGVVGSVLYVAAHPDDENTALLSYLANGLLVRSAYLSITRGDVEDAAD